MKNILSILLTLLTLSVYAGDPITISAQAERATVFLNGAQLFHTKTVNLPAGNTDIVIEGISQSLDQNSIQAGGKGEFTILDVQYRLFYPEPVQQTTLPNDIQKKIKYLEDSILDIDFILKDIRQKRDVLNVQNQMLLSNKILLTNGGTDSLQLLQQTIEYYDLKLNAIYSDLLKLERKELNANLSLIHI